MYTEEKLKEIESFAGRGFTIQEIAIIIQEPVEAFEKCFFDQNNPVTQAFMRGTLLAQMDIRNALYDSALSGSSPAQVEISKIFHSQIAYLKELTSDA